MSEKKSWHVPRRTFLRGASAALALPMLGAMAPFTRRALASDSGSLAPTPTRFAALYFPNGAFMDNWVPKQTGADFELPFSLTPLAPVRSEVLVLSGLDKPNSRQGDGHYAKTANFLTGFPVAKTTGSELSVGGQSLDQFAASRIGGQTPLPSLELAIDPVISGIDSNVGFTRLYGSFISWRAADVPMAREINPRAAYQRLFGAKDGSGLPTEDGQALDDAQSLLDMALEDARSLRRKLGRDDQFKLDEYMDAVRNVERRLAFHSQPDPREWRPSSAPNHPDEPAVTGSEDHQEHVRLMLDLIVLAFWTDTTRLSTFMFANSVSNKNFSQLIDGVHGGHHELSHHQSQAAAIEQYSKINRWHVEQFVYMLERMRNIREGEGTLLDNSMIVCGSGLSDGNAHDPNNLPILLGGRGGGQFNTGRHIASEKNTPLCNLYVPVLNALGIKSESFGDSTRSLNLA
ncbi:DUF1552 domain-containing protein [Lacipirellula sp.]|uniref:DUF1552 domain-containing protein n=1 Tax=Lacipirellula sp. TaxID=2691419 RepID=UPI003D116E75